MNSTVRRSAHNGGWMAGLALAMVVFVATPALAADTSQATANAIRATLAGGGLLDSGTVTAMNDGDDPDPGVVTGAPGVGVLPANTLLSAGVLPQQAQALINGTSAACAGLVGAGGTIQIGPAGDCTVTGAPPGGVVLNLGAVVGGNLSLTADAVLAQCTANSNGTTTATVQLVNASLGVGVLGLPPLISVPLPAAGGPVDLGVLGLGGALTLVLNEQTIPAGPGSIATTALHLNLLNVVDLRIGNVTCGPNVAGAGIPLIPMDGLPFALATLGIVGAAVLVVHRRRSA